MIGHHISISCIFIAAMTCAVGHAAQQTPETEALNQFLALSDDQIDLGIAKLTFDRLIDPNISIEAANLRLNAMVADINRMVADVVPPGKETAKHKMLALRTYLYDPGHWNAQKVFRYDLNDPLGKNIRNKLLVNYLDTRQGNCVSMPILFVILGQRLGIDVKLSLAPLHLLVTFTDDKGVTQYLETTSGAHPARKEWLKQGFNITDTAIDNGIYLRPLNKKEMVAVIGETLMEQAMKQRDYDKAIGIANVMLETDPNNIHAMLAKATNQSLFIKAERLSWRQPTPEQENRYLESVRTFAQSAKAH
jgi:regulator of sirC expression with transglutaminase-like and TPR domain